MRYLGQSAWALLSVVSGSALAALAVLAVPLALAPLIWVAALLCCRHPLLDELAQLARRRITSRK
jgi:hypothetical protein